MVSSARGGPVELPRKWLGAENRKALTSDARSGLPAL